MDDLLTEFGDQAPQCMSFKDVIAQREETFTNLEALLGHVQQALEPSRLCNSREKTEYMTSWWGEREAGEGLIGQSIKKTEELKYLWSVFQSNMDNDG